MFPVCPLCCFIVMSMDPVSEINDDDDNDKKTAIFFVHNFVKCWPLFKFFFSALDTDRNLQIGVGNGLSYKLERPISLKPLYVGMQ